MAKTAGEALREGTEYFYTGRLPNAERVCREILEHEPENPDALHLLGAIALQRGNLQTALDSLNRAVRCRRRSFVFRNSLGEVHRRLGQRAMAIDCYNAALTIRPDYFEALYNRGLALNELGRPAEALVDCDEAQRLRPELAEVLAIRGVTLMALGRFQEAAQGFDRALKINPLFAEAWSNRGLTMAGLGRAEDAIASFRRALEINPHCAEALNNLGNTLREQGQVVEAEQLYAAALALKPQSAEVLNNLGLVTRDRGQLKEAAERFRQALAVRAEYPEALSALGSTQFYLGRLEEAEASFRRALELRPEYVEAYAFWVHVSQHLCAFPVVEHHADRLRALATESKSGEIAPFIASALPGATAAEELSCAQYFAQRSCASYFARSAFARRTPDRNRLKLRVGYLSADYRDHATSHLLAEVIELHDRRRLEVIGYSYGPNDASATRKRMEAAFDKFRDISTLTHESAARQIYNDEIDILVDLKGYTGGNRIQITAQRPAPVQVSWLGYPGTLGDCRLVDYIIGDPVVTPLEHAWQYSERLVLLPHCYQPNDRKRVIGTQPTRSKAALPARAFVFCSFNQSYKITPEIFELWCRLLKEVRGSVLWLLQPNRVAQENLRREAQARGVAPDRLVFAPRLPLSAHLGRLQLADLALDTFPHNSHTTASDALWAGVPLVTRMGQAFASRVAASILNAAGMKALVAVDLGSYFEKALDLATHPTRLKELKTKLIDNRLKWPLFDSKRFAKDLERGYQAIWTNYVAGTQDHVVLAPEARIRRR
jgi:predicted O-linked N-acetylglucosamine transferase (SPINDLY family)